MPARGWPNASGAAAVAFLLTLLLAGASHAQQSVPKIPQPFAEVYKRIDASPKLRERHAMCPADLFEVDAPFWLNTMHPPRIDPDQCLKDPDQCLAGCLDGRSFAACFTMAITLQMNQPEEKSRYFEMLFAEACATGSAGGCTNRAAAIRNGSYFDDPFDDVDEAEAMTCVFRSFEVTCAEGDAWGCTMLGQAYHHGEGVEADSAAARRYYEKSCEIAPNFAACEMAKEKTAVLP